MLEFVPVALVRGARKNILPECELIRIDKINEAFQRKERADVRYRLVIDMDGTSRGGQVHSLDISGLLELGDFAVAHRPTREEQRTCGGAIRGRRRRGAFCERGTGRCKQLRRGARHGLVRGVRADQERSTGAASPTDLESSTRPLNCPRLSPLVSNNLRKFGSGSQLGPLMTNGQGITHISLVTGWAGDLESAP